MTAVYLDRLWVSDAADPSVRRGCTPVTQLSEQPESDLDVRLTASGRLRVMRRAGGVRTSLAVELGATDRATATWLRGMVGRPVCVRDWTGRRLYGVYKSVSISEIDGAPALVQVSFTLTETSEP